MRTTFRTAAIAASLVLLAATVTSAQTPPAGNTQRLQGGWVLTVIPDPGAPVVPPVQPGVFVMLFTTDGGVMSQQNDALPPGLVETGGAGSWERVGEDRFAVTQRYTVALLDATGGHPANIVVQRLLLHYESRDRLAGTADWAALDLAGNVLFSAPFTVTLERVKPQLVGSSF